MKKSKTRFQGTSKKMTKEQRGITLVALVITILFSYDERIKCSDSKGSLLEAIW